MSVGVEVPLRAERDETEIVAQQVLVTPQLTWDGRWIWLVPCWKRMVQRHQHLDGGKDRWFQYHFPYGYVAVKGDRP